MLSVETLRSVELAANYYENADYYTKEEQQHNSSWFGAGANNLNLTGLVDPVMFKNILKGELPDGTIMQQGYNAKGKKTRRPGYDLTFSAPKSVSILAAKDPRLIAAHNKAVIATLNQIEQQAAARCKINGVEQNKITKNLVVATFLHRVSRSLDPDLHTHCVVANMTAIKGKWRSLYGYDFYKFKKPLGLEYRLELVKNIMQLGYELEQTSKQGFFEIKGVPKKVIKQLSKRRQEIEQLLQEQGLEPQQKVTMVLYKGTAGERAVTTVASAMANLVTRKQKNVANINQLQEHWDQEVKLAGSAAVELENIINKAHARVPIKVASLETAIIKAIPLAINHLASKKAIFTKAELLFAVKACCVTSLPNNSFVEQVIIKQINEKELIPLEGDRFTTLGAIQLEKTNIAMMQQQQGKCSSILAIDPQIAVKPLLNECGKVEALQMLLTSKDRFMAIDAGQELAQQQVLKAFNYIAGDCQSYVIAATHEQAKDLAQAVGVARAFSLNGFLYYAAKLIAAREAGQLNNLFTVHFWWLQRSHMLSSQELATIAEYAIKLNARVVLLGDRMRTGGINAGAPFRYLLDNGISQVNLTENKVNSLTLLRAKKVQAAIEQLEQDGSLVEIADRKARIQQAVDFVINNNAVLITQTKADNQTANFEIRTALQKRAQLSGAIVTVQVLIPVNLSNYQKESLANYQVGDVIRFNKGIQNSIYVAGRYFTIVAINHPELILENNNHTYSLAFNSNYSNKIALYRPQTRELQLGDQLIWRDHTPRKLQPNIDFIKSSAKIIGISQNQQIELILPNGKTFTLDLTLHHHQHIEYAYAQLLSATNMQDFTNGAILLNSNHIQAISLTEIYTSISSITGRKMLFCSNIQLLKQAMIKQDGLPEHAHLQQQVPLNKDIPANDFAKAKGEIEGALARHQLMLAKIVPEIKLLNNTPLNLPKTDEYLGAIEAVNFAVTKLAERNAIFTAPELLEMAKQYDITIAAHLVEAAINQAIFEGWVINKGEHGLTTKEVYAMECACLKIQKQGAGAVEPIIVGPSPRLDAIIEHKYFTESQKQAVLLVATSNDRVNLIQGIAGSGKTSMLKEVKKLAIAAGFELLGVANTASAKNNLQLKTASELYELDQASGFAAAGILSKTLASFINQTGKILATDPLLAKHIYAKHPIFILDEASLVSVRDMFLFLDLVEQLDGRAIIVGDHAQLPSIGASRAFKLLLGHSNSKVVMNINTRLQTKRALQLVQAIYAARIDDAFDKLLSNLVEIPDRAERLQAMANYYLAANKEQRVAIMPMLPLNRDRVEFNNLIRAGLKKQGVLTGMEISTNILVAKDLTNPETTYYLSFDVGNWVKFNYGISRLGINKGDFLVVTGRKDHQILLLDQNGNKVQWDPVRFATNFKGGVEIYNINTRGIMVGDLIRWKRNDEARGMINSETAEVIKVMDQVVELKLNNGKLLALDLTKKANQHWDHAYGATVHMVQGLDKYNPIGQGLGAAPGKRDITTVKPGDQIVIPGDQTNNTIAKIGKVVKIIATTRGTEIIAIDRLNNEHKLSQKIIEVYPDFSQARAPKISTLESFLVMATRGDQLIMFVDNIDGYKAAIGAKQNLKQTALAIMLPNLGNELEEQANATTSRVYGLANLDELTQLKNNKENTITNNNIAKIKNQKSAKPAPTTIPITLNFNKQKEQLKQPKFDPNEIKLELQRNVLSYVAAWKGEPDHKSGREARWGKKGSFSVVVAGPKLGTWADFEAGVAGQDLISLYMHIFNLSKAAFPQALQELAKVTGIGAIEDKKNINITKQINAQKARELAQARTKYINKVEKLYASAIPIKGTLAEKYFHEYRGIQAKLPNNFRFKARCWHDELKAYKPALIVPGYGTDGKLQAINRIYLNKDGSKLNEEVKNHQGLLQPATAKRNYGPIAGTTIKINEHAQSDVMLVTEGIENALSIKQAWPEVNIISSFGVGQLKNLSVEPGTKIIMLCADNDGLSVNTKKPMLEALQTWLEQGYQVKIAMPVAASLEQKIDFNDLLNSQGIQAIKQCLSSAISISDLGGFKNKTSSLSQDFITIQKQQYASLRQVFNEDNFIQNKEKSKEKELGD